MLNKIESFYLQQQEPIQSIFLLLRKIILDIDENITESYKYKTAFFSYKNKMYCYLWYNKKTNEPYIGIVKGSLLNHPDLESGSRTKMKILKISENKNIDIQNIKLILNMALKLYN